MNNFFYKVNDKEYEVVVTPKRIRNYHYRFKDGKFVVSCPYIYFKSTIIKGLDEFGEKLIKRSTKPSPIKENGMYLFGKFHELSYPGKLKIDGKEISFKNSEELLKKLKPIFLNFVTSRVRYFQSQMRVEPYKVRVQKMKTRYGSNSRKTKTLNFNLNLLHYDVEVIDSVVVHELAHIVVFDHSKKFYDVVYRYCPYYNQCRKMLVKGVYHAESYHK